MCVHTYPKVLAHTFVPLHDAASKVQLILVRRCICTFHAAHGAGTFVSTREQKKVARFVPTSGHSALAHLRLTFNCSCVRSCDRMRLTVDHFCKRRRGHGCTWCEQDGDCPCLPPACAKLWHAQGPCGMAPPEGHNHLQRTLQQGISEAQLWQRVLLGQGGYVLCARCMANMKTEAHRVSNCALVFCPMPFVAGASAVHTLSPYYAL